MTKRLPKWTFAVFPLVLASAAYGSTGANSTRSSNDPKMPRHPSPSLIGDRRANAPIIMTIVTVEIGRAHVLTPVTNAHLVCRLLLENKKNEKTVRVTKRKSITH